MNKNIVICFVLCTALFFVGCSISFSFDIPSFERNESFDLGPDVNDSDELPKIEEFVNETHLTIDNGTNVSIIIDNETELITSGGNGHTDECRNDKDDDGDGLIDYPEDPGCDSRFDDDETNAVVEGENVSDVTPLSEGVYNPLRPQEERDDVVSDDSATFNGDIDTDEKFNSVQDSVEDTQSAETKTAKTPFVMMWVWILIVAFLIAGLFIGYTVMYKKK